MGRYCSSGLWLPEFWALPTPLFVLCCGNLQILNKHLHLLFTESCKEEGGRDSANICHRVRNMLSTDSRVHVMVLLQSDGAGRLQWILAFFSHPWFLSHISQLLRQSRCPVLRQRDFQKTLQQVSKLPIFLTA